LHDALPISHGAFRGLPDHVVGIAHLEQIEARIGNPPQDGKAHIDDVLVAREHQPVFARAAPGRTHPRLVFRGRGAFDALDRPPMEMQPRIGEFVLGLAEQQFDPDLVRRDGVNRLAGPEHQTCRDRPDDQPAPATGNPAAELLPPAGENIFEIGGITATPVWPPWSAATASAARCLAPRAPAATPPAAPIVFPRHLVPFGCRENVFCAVRNRDHQYVSVLYREARPGDQSKPGAAYGCWWVEATRLFPGG